jgi:hypothetical protein
MRRFCPLHPLVRRRRDSARADKRVGTDAAPFGGAERAAGMASITRAAAGSKNPSQPQLRDKNLTADITRSDSRIECMRCWAAYFSLQNG